LQLEYWLVLLIYKSKKFAYVGQEFLWIPIY